jgi:CDP-glucose 4,6-dehydratase
MSDFYRGRRVFLTGHTGFKGAWLSLWLQKLGAKVTGYSLEPNTHPNLFELCQVSRGMTSIVGDIRDARQLAAAIRRARPEIVFHLAAQSLVGTSYVEPVATLETNVIGTAHVLEACRSVASIKVVLVVTTDKCYAQMGEERVFTEADALGGNDVYSASKACAEIVTASFRKSFFGDDIGIATARAGNVVGGGDWAKDRLIPDCVRAFIRGEKVLLRHPAAIRPWQHVLEALGGYLVLGEQLTLAPKKFRGAWNFGPRSADMWPVRDVTVQLVKNWGGSAAWGLAEKITYHEEPYLKLDSGRAEKLLRWKPVWDVDETLRRTVDWYKAFDRGEDLRALTLRQIDDFAEVHSIQRRRRSARKG